MTELLQYLYQPTGFTNHLLNITIAGLLMTVVIGFVALHTKRNKAFLFHMAICRHYTKCWCYI